MKKPLLHVLKIGGKLIEQEEKLEKVLAHFLRKKGGKILIHGGGKKATEMGLALSTPAPMLDGRRITDEATLDIVVMVYAGLINKGLVSRLQALGSNALGLSGADGNAILAHKRPVTTIDYGFAGDIDEINTGLIQILLETGIVPVFCAITHDGKGQLLNTNADTIAASVSTALADVYEVRTYFCLEKNGVLSNPADDFAVLSRMAPGLFNSLKADGIISAGMIPKLENGFEALSRGVGEVIICGPESFVKDGGTKLVL